MIYSTGNVLCGTGENNAGIGVTAWTNPGNITLDDGSDATCNAGASSQYLVARNFSFAIPDGAVILGITVQIEASEHSAGTESLNAQLQDATGALFGASKAQTISGTTKAVYTYGSSSDTWSAALTGAIVSDVDFGVRFWFTTSHDVRADFVKMAVQYMLPVGGRTPPNPVLPKSSGFVTFPNLLCTTLAVVTAVTLPFAQFDWPVPPGPEQTVRPHFGRMITEAPPDLQARPPVFVPRQQPRSQVLTGSPNLLTSIVAPVVNPFAQLSWPNPRGATPVVTLRGQASGRFAPPEIGETTPRTETYAPRLTAKRTPPWEPPNLLSNTLSIVAAGPPFAQTNWPNPRGPRAASDLRTWSDSIKLTLISTDTMVPAYSWESTFIRSVQQPNYVPNLVLATLASSPIAQKDWPNPRGAVPAISLRTHLDPFKLQLQDTFFGLAGKPQYDWPVPRGPVPSIVLRTFVEPVKLTLRQPELPFALFDWPVPKGAIPGVSLKTHLDPLKLNLLSQDQFYGLAGSPQYDWPVPKGAVPSIALKSHLDPYKLNLASQDALPFRQTVWPVPKGPIPSISLKSELGALDLLNRDKFFGLGGAPQFNWPNPRGYARATELLTHISVSRLNINTVGVAWNLRGTIVRTPTGEQKCVFTLTTGSAVLPAMTQYTLTAADLATPLNLKLVISGSLSGDVAGELWKEVWFPTT